jgi:hypothetical protein
MSGKHRKVRARRIGALGIATAGVLLAATSGVAVASTGTSTPTPKDCTDTVAALIAARVTERGTHDQLVALQADVVAKLVLVQTSNNEYTDAKAKADDLDAARKTTAAELTRFDAEHPDKTKLTPEQKIERGRLANAAADAQTAYDDPKTGYAYWRGRQAAAADRQATALGPWRLAGSKASDARKADQEQNRLIAALQIKVGQLCKDAPPVPDSPPVAQQPPAATAPTPVEAHLPVTH